MIVQLSAAELKMIEDLVRGDLRVSKANGYYKPLEAEEDEFERMFAGKKGELAFSKFTGAAMNMKNEIDIFDFLIFHRGVSMTVDVKTSYRPDANLNVVFGKKDKPCDLYVLAIAPRGGNLVIIIGQATAEEVFQKKNLTDSPFAGKKQFWMIRQEDLAPFTIFPAGAEWFPDPE